MSFVVSAIQNDR